MNYIWKYLNTKKKKKKTCSIITTNATAVTNPADIGFDKIESKNPKRSNPAVNVNNPENNAIVWAIPFLFILFYFILFYWIKNERFLLGRSDSSTFKLRIICPVIKLRSASGPTERCLNKLW